MVILTDRRKIILSMPSTFSRCPHVEYVGSDISLVVFRIVSFALKARVHPSCLGSREGVEFDPISSCREPMWTPLDPSHVL